MHSNTRPRPCLPACDARPARCCCCRCRLLQLYILVGFIQSRWGLFSRGRVTAVGRAVGERGRATGAAPTNKLLNDLAKPEHTPARSAIKFKSGSQMLVSVHAKGEDGVGRVAPPAAKGGRARAYCRRVGTLGTCPVHTCPPPGFLAVGGDIQGRKMSSWSSTRIL